MSAPSWSALWYRVRLLARVRFRAMRKAMRRLWRRRWTPVPRVSPAMARIAALREHVAARDGVPIYLPQYQRMPICERRDTDGWLTIENGRVIYPERDKQAPN